MTPNKQPADTAKPQVAHRVRDSRVLTPAVLYARTRPMAERLELALSWNAVAAELRAGMVVVLEQAQPKH
ncbi:MAG: hypothetical protein JHC87_05100 [Thermoleophilaceae bacterium]|nr:hypothetical protein [Thermoleophilaceae bacterium]